MTTEERNMDETGPRTEAATEMTRDEQERIAADLDRIAGRLRQAWLAGHLTSDVMGLIGILHHGSELLREDRLTAPAIIGRRIALAALSAGRLASLRQGDSE